MPSSTLEQWRAANLQATEAERNYFRAALAYSRGSGPEPSAELAAETTRLRDHAKSLFAAAMKELDAKEQSIRHSRPRDPGESRAH